MTTNFWQPQPIDSIVASQQTQPVSDLSTLQADFWPEDESADDFIAFVEQQRREDNTANEGTLFLKILPPFTTSRY